MLLTREKLEEWEARTLAPYAMKSRNSRGRAVQEEEPHYRTVFQRDRDRIIHTTAFRRLEYKTQVFVITEGDYYRTRLTHEIEVNQIGRSIAQALQVNLDLVEAIILAHDLGHPPFGHSGEYTLRDLMEPYGGFEHNRHSLRIVDELEERYPRFRGLNLTYEVREGLVKHETDYDIVDATGYDPDLSATLEAQIASIADELAYSTHDLDDGLRSGMITLEQVGQIDAWKRAVRRIQRKYSGLEGDLLRHAVVRELIGYYIADCLRVTDRKLNQLEIDSVDDVRQAERALCSLSPEAQEEFEELKAFLLKNLYRHYRVMRMQEKARQIVTDLFTAYLAMPELLPGWIQARIDGEGKARVICDYIAGMTDRFATEEHQRLFDPYARV
jgi:dGTPase